MSPGRTRRYSTSRKRPRVHFRIAFTAEIQTVGIAEAEFGRKDIGRRWTCGNPVHLSAAVMCCWRASCCPVRANAPPCSETSGRTSHANTDCCRVQVRQAHGCGLCHPSGLRRTGILPLDCTAARVRGQVAVHVSVPHTQSLLQGIHSHAVARSLVHYMKIEVDGVALAIFQITHQLVVPEFVTAFHELVQFQHRVLFGGQITDFLPNPRHSR